MNLNKRDTMLLTCWGVIVLVIYLSVLVMFARDAFAHDHEHPENNAWLSKLKSSNGDLCCSGSDATTLEDPQWQAPGETQNKTGHYRVYIDVSPTMADKMMQWVEVPDEAVVSEPSKDGLTRVWPIRGYLGMSIRCFQPGSFS